MKHSPLIIVLILLIVLGNSCRRAPFACFNTSVPIDSIRVFEPVTFSAACSSGADDFFWQFYGKDDSTEFGFSVTKTFYDTGKVEIYMLVIAGRKTASVRDFIDVKP